MRHPAAPAVDRGAIERFVRALFASAPHDAFVELRVRREARMAQSFHRVMDVRELAAVAAAQARQYDVYVGVVARARRGGGRRDLIPRASAVWADCDGPDAVRALGDFEPAPHIVVASGSARNRHAYWLLAEPVPVDDTSRSTAASRSHSARTSGRAMRRGSSARRAPPTGREASPRPSSWWRAIPVGGSMSARSGSAFPMTSLNRPQRGTGRQRATTSTATLCFGSRPARTSSG